MSDCGFNLGEEILKARIDELNMEWPELPKDGSYDNLLEWIMNLDELYKSRISELSKKLAIIQGSYREA